MADELGIKETASELLPGDKVDRVEALLKETAGKGKLIFVGDGINDAPVLARADIGVAMGGLGSDAAIEAADIVIMTDEPSKIALAMRISGKTLRIVRQNIVFAIGIKILVYGNRNELCGVQRPCGKSGRKSRGSYLLHREPFNQFHGRGRNRLRRSGNCGGRKRRIRRVEKTRSGNGKR